MDSSGSTEHGSPLPCVADRLAQLRPSKELLDYYRKKVADYDKEHEKMYAKLDNYKCTYEEQYKLERELQQRSDEIAELQKALSDMQVYLFQERDQVLRLYAENDRLKIQELDDRKKIQHLLSLSYPHETEVTYFVKGHPPTVTSREKVGEKARGRPHSPVLGHRERYEMKDRGPGGHRKAVSKSDTQPADGSRQLVSDNQTLQLQMESLQAQMEELTAHSKEQVSALMEDRRVLIKEHEAGRILDSEKIQSLADRLNKTQALLFESTKEYLELKYDCQHKERKWMSERDRLTQELDALNDRLDLSRQDLELQAPLHVHAGTQMLDDSKSALAQHNKVRLTSNMVISQLRSNLEQTQKMAELYREQVIGLEDELARIREENDTGKDVFKERTDKLTKRLKLMNARYEALEKRRGLEVEGFKNDIKILRERLKDVEKQLFKVTVNIGEQFDWEILKNVYHTANRSKKLAGDLHQLKAKVYGLEHELKQL